jgi:hypothetical protein
MKEQLKANGYDKKLNSLRVIAQFPHL